MRAHLAPGRGSRTSRRLPPVLALVAAVSIPAALPAQLVRSTAGANAAAIQGTVNQFRADLGALNPNVAGSFGSGRREINWDGVPDGRSAPNNLPPDFFNVNSPRGVVFATPGTGFQVSANAASGTAIEFGNINPSYPGIFGVFSPQRLFSALGSNVVDVNFFIAGSNTPALTRGFGAVFTDVDLPNVTSIEYFDAHGGSLGTYFASPLVGANETLSFLGVSFATSVVGRVRITSGNTALGPDDAPFTAGLDVVVMDDFVYGEPVSAVPEPATLALVGIGLAALGVARRRRTSAR